MRGRMNTCWNCPTRMHSDFSFNPINWHQSHKRIPDTAMSNLSVVDSQLLGPKLGRHADPSQMVDAERSPATFESTRPSPTARGHHIVLCSDIWSWNQPYSRRWKLPSKIWNRSSRRHQRKRAHSNSSCVCWAIVTQEGCKPSLKRTSTKTKRSDPVAE